MSNLQREYIMHRQLFIQDGDRSSKSRDTGLDRSFAEGSGGLKEEA